MIECEFCEEEKETKAKMRTHMVLKHREELETNDLDLFESQVSEGHLDNETRSEKGEQFGYK